MTIIMTMIVTGNRKMVPSTEYNIIILPNFLEWKFYGNAQFPQSFERSVQYSKNKNQATEIMMRLHHHHIWYGYLLKVSIYITKT